MPICTTTLYHFDRVTDPEHLKIISGMNNTTCSSDPFPTRLLISHLYAILPILQHIVNLCLTMGDFPISCKSSIVIRLIMLMLMLMFVQLHLIGSQAITG